MKEEILACLPPEHPWRSLVQCYDQVDSTNTLAKTLAAQGAPAGTVLLADRQSAGRGRLGRSFLSPAGAGIYMSVILRPRCAPEGLMHLTCACAEAMCDATQQAVGLRPGIKWTNDLVAGGKKIAGILTELGFHTPEKVDYAVVGIGINCSPGAFPPELQKIAGSLAEITGRPVSRPRLAAAMITALERMDRQLLTDIPGMLRAYRRDCITLGKEISLVNGDSVTHGRALDVLPDGALLVELPDGSRKAVSSGEVSVRGLYGYV